MARTSNKLTATAVEKRKAPGRMGDGGGLWLNVTKTGRKSWVFRWKPTGGAVKEIGLGAYPAVTLQRAREIAIECQSHRAEGRDPKTERDKEKGEAGRTFKQARDEFLELNENAWRNAKHRQQWRNTLEQHAAPILNMPVAILELEDVLRVLKPIWQTKPETASRVRGRIERVIAFAIAKKWRTAANPAIWRGNLDAILPTPKKLTRGHHKALQWRDVPDFMAQLRERDSLAALALRVLILTASRSGEVLGARWDEMDLDQALWTVPAHRMKAGKEHRVPLAGEALEVLAGLSEARTGEFVFPGQRPIKPLSGMALTMQLRRLDRGDITVHGFRSSFRDWAGDATGVPREIAEGCLAHVVGSAVERAYRRGDALDQRRALLTAWGEYCAGATGSNVVALHG